MNDFYTVVKDVESKFTIPFNLIEENERDAKYGKVVHPNVSLISISEIFNYLPNGNMLITMDNNPNNDDIDNIEGRAYLVTIENNTLVIIACIRFSFIDLPSGIFLTSLLYDDSVTNEFEVIFENGVYYDCLTPSNRDTLRLIVNEDGSFEEMVSYDVNKYTFFKLLHGLQSVDYYILSKDNESYKQLIVNGVKMYYKNVEVSEEKNWYIFLIETSHIKFTLTVNIIGGKTIRLNHIFFNALKRESRESFSEQSLAIRKELGIKM